MCEDGYCLTHFCSSSLYGFGPRWAVHGVWRLMSWHVHVHIMYLSVVSQCVGVITVLVDLCHSVVVLELCVSRHLCLACSPTCPFVVVSFSHAWFVGCYSCLTSPMMAVSLEMMREHEDLPRTRHDFDLSRPERRHLSSEHPIQRHPAIHRLLLVCGVCGVLCACSV